MRTIFDFDHVVAHKSATLLYDAKHHLLREALFSGLAEYYQPDPTGERAMLLKPGDLTSGEGALCVEQVPISIVDILPDEYEFREEETLAALNESPVLALHLRRTEPTALRQELRAISQVVANMRQQDLYKYIVATSYSELIRLAVRGAGMHPASVQSVSKYILARGEKHWKEYAGQNYPEGRNPIGRQEPVYRLASAFMSTVEFAALHERL